MMKRVVAGLALLVAMAAGAGAATLDQVKARGHLTCGVNPGLQGFAAKAEDGSWAGFDVDFCRAVAAAVLGDASKVEFMPLDTQSRFERLAGGEIDILARNTTWTMERETKLPLRFVGISYHDGQGFIVKTLLGVTSALNMTGAAICFLAGTTTEDNVEDFFREKNMSFTPMRFDKLDDLIAAFDAGKCDSYTADAPNSMRCASSLPIRRMQWCWRM